MLERALLRTARAIRATKWKLANKKNNTERECTDQGQGRQNCR